MRCEDEIDELEEEKIASYFSRKWPASLEKKGEKVSLLCLKKTLMREWL